MNFILKCYRCEFCKFNKATINEFINYGLLAKDARALRECIVAISPGPDLKYKYETEDGVVEDINMPITVGFFWPDAGL